MPVELLAARKCLDLAEFDLDLVPVNGLHEQMDIDSLLMGDLKSTSWTSAPS